jgi:hypothetical protein
MEAMRSSETSALTGPTRRNIPEDVILHSHRREDLWLKSEQPGCVRCALICIPLRFARFVKPICISAVGCQASHVDVTLCFFLMTAATSNDLPTLGSADVDKCCFRKFSFPRPNRHKGRYMGSSPVHVRWRALVNSVMNLRVP